MIRMVYGKPISSATYWEKFEPPMEIIKKKKASRAKINRCIANKVLYRKKRVDSGTKISVPEIRVVGTHLKVGSHDRRLWYWRVLTPQVITFDP